MKGRPLRFLGVVLGGWTLFRVAMLMPDATRVPRVIQADRVAVVRAAAVLAGASVRVADAPRMATVVHGDPLGKAPRAVVGRRVRPALPVAAIVAVAFVQREAIAVAAQDGAGPAVLVSPVFAASGVPEVQPGGPRLGGSAWLLARGGPSGTLSGGQLGASQAGLRLTYALGDARRVALAARLAAPFAGRGREAALGVEWRPTRLPVRLVVEQRFVLDGGRGGPTIGVIGGYGPGEIMPGIRLETYGQAGAIARGGVGSGGGTVEGFVDAAARVTRPIGMVRGVRVDAGLGGWGSAQRGVARLDSGPTIGVAVPLAGRSIRVAVDWRQRIAGTARPGSGLALSVGSDF